MSVASADPEGFRRVGHSLLSLLFALVGGWLSRHFHAARDWQPSGSHEGGGSVRAPTSTDEGVAHGRCDEPGLGAPDVTFIAVKGVDVYGTWRSSGFT